MNREGNRMKHGKALLLAMAMAVMTACASGGTPAAEEADTGNRPRETEGTRAASVHLVQAGLAEGEAAREQYREALADALTGIEEMPTNPKAYLIAGQAAAGLGDWVQADTMFDKAEALYPRYQEQIEAEREQAWVIAYNQGAEALNAEDIDLALEMFRGADQIYQGRPEARIALGSLYAREGDLTAAAESYVGALEILSADPPAGLSDEQIGEWQQSRQVAAMNAAELLAQAGEFDRAAEVLEGYLAEHGEQLDAATSRRARTALAGFYAQAGDAERAETLYNDLLGAGDLSADEYFQAGIGFFNTGDFDRAAEAFGSAAELNPYSRDALLNLVQSLYSQAVELEKEPQTAERDDQLRSIYQRLLETATEVRELDPLNRNLISFMLRSYRALADLSSGAEATQLTQRTQGLFREYQNQPYEVSDLRLSMENRNTARVGGTLTNLTANAGENVQLRFEVLGEQGRVVDSAMIEVTAPEQGASVPFQGTLNVEGGTFAGWRYSLVR